MRKEDNKPPSVKIWPLENTPLIQANDNLAAIIAQALVKEKRQLSNSDILVIAQKIVSKAENRVVNIAQYNPTKRALEISQASGRDPRLIQVMLDESQEILKVGRGTKESPGIIVTRHRLGHVCTSAGIDKSNTGSADTDTVVLLPENPDQSAREIADYFLKKEGVKIGVIIIDSMGDPYRVGAIGKAIGVANVPSRHFETELKDIDGKSRKSDIALADSIAAFAMILMGQTDELVPVVVIRGLEYPFSPNASINDVLL